MHQLGIEPRSADWKSAILPFNYWCFVVVYLQVFQITPSTVLFGVVPITPKYTTCLS